jgi:3-hydroxyacyl-[acyl-carrier-protein] dehydratase
MKKAMVLEDFYKILEVESPSAEKMSVKVELKPGHPVYKGHFPDIPVAPGVCLIQMIKEVLMQHRNQNLQLTEGDNIKFMALVNPNVNPFFIIDYDLRMISDLVLGVTALIRWDATTYLKFKGKFGVIE